MLVRNFCIISHIDHGKTTLTDRLLEMTNTVDKREMHDRFLDSHPISQERGVTIKLAPVRMTYLLPEDLKTIFNFEFPAPPPAGLIFNLIDTPGHADFAYEVSRSLAACEGAVLLVDATQGIQAQTIANAQAALKQNLKLIPVINKIDLANADVTKTTTQIVETFGFSQAEILTISAKTGENVDKLLKEIAIRLPQPKGDIDKPLRCLIFSSIYDPFKGVVVFVRVVDGCLEQKEKIIFLASDASCNPHSIGIFTPKMKPVERLTAGEVGWIATGLKDMSLCRVGDTITKAKPDNQQLVVPLPGYKEPKPMVFADFYPVDNNDYKLLHNAAEKLKLDDAALFFKPIHSSLFGQGLKMGFLGLFHAEIVQERLERDFDLEIISTTPSVEYKIVLHSGEEKLIFSAQECPALFKVEEILEPYIKLSIYVPLQFVGPILRLCQEHRANFLIQNTFSSQAQLIYEMPLMELISNFYDRLKSISSGFASLDWELVDFKPLKAVMLEILVNKQKVPPLTFILPKENAAYKAREIASRLKKAIDRQQFEVVVQASLDGKIVCSERIPPFRKDVTQKLYGGDQTRKDKLLKKQKKGKKRMKAIGKVNIPQQAFMAVFRE